MLLLACLIVGPRASAQQLAIPGKFDVGPTGGSTYNIPIKIPPGSGGMMPSLSLQYSSHQANGFVGLGWALSGLPSITRCAQTLAQDHAVVGITYTNTDRACLDGQRLILITPAIGYWGNGSEYRTERDSFSRIIYHAAGANGPSYFEVHTKAGQEMDYGDAPDANTTTSQVLVPGTSTVRMWNIGEVKDYAGNFYTVTYQHDNANGVAYPLIVRYTANVNVPQSSYNSVQFVYSTNRPDQVPFYRAGYATMLTQLLTDVQTCLSATYPCPAGKLVNDYHLTYATSSSTGRSELTSVTLYDSGGYPNGNALPPTTFNWQGASTPFGTSHSIPPGSAGNFAGDGRTDLFGPTKFYLAGENGAYTDSGMSYSAVFGSTTFNPTVTGDWDGDGRTDIFSCTWSSQGGNPLNPSTANCQAYVSATSANGSPTFLPFANSLSFTDFVAGVGNYTINFYVGDFNGDGKSDILVTYDHPSGITTANIYLSSVDGSGNPVFVQQSTSFSWDGASKVVLGDFDGDGRTDIALLNTNFEGYYASDFSTKRTLIAGYGNNYVPIIGDWNGDGKTDLALVPGAGVSDSNTHFFLATGAGFTAMNFSPPWIAWIPYSTAAHTFVPVDANGDGMTDILYDGALWTSNGATFSHTADAPAGYTTASGILAGATPPPADVDGNGASDLYLLNPSTGALSVFLTTFQPDLVTGFTTGLGATTSVVYSPMDRAQYNTKPFYTKGSSATYPVQDVQNAMYVVAEVDAPNYSGTNYDSHTIKSYYSYSGAQTEVDGRGFMGFTTVQSSMQAFDLPTANALLSPDTLENTTTYYMFWPATGLVHSTLQTVDGTGKVKSATYSYCPYIYCITYNGTYPGVSDISPTEVDTAAWELNSNPANLATTGPSISDETTTTKYTYDTDTYGNATTITKTTGDGYGSTTTNVYSNTVTNGTNANPYLWVIGKLTSSTVTASAPNAADVTRTTTYSYCLPGGTSCCLSTYTACAQPFGYVYNVLVDPPNTTTTFLRTTYGYDTWGNRASVTVNGYKVAVRTTTTTFDSVGRFPVTATDALGMSDTYVYDPNFGGISQHTDPNGNLTQTFYDGFGRKTRELRPDLSETDWAYAPAANNPVPAQLTNCTLICNVSQTTIRVDGTSTYTVAPNTTMFFDQLERPGFIATTSFGDPNTSIVSKSTTYDAMGHPATVAMPYQGNDTVYHSTYLYDALGRVISETRPDTSVVATSYGVLQGSRLTTATLSAANASPAFASETTKSWKDSQGNVIGTFDDAVNKYARFTYDGFGDMLTAKDPAGNTATMTYDARGHMIERNDPDLGDWTFGVDALGEVVLQTDAIGQTTAQSTAMVYDKLGRMTQRTETPADTNALTIVSNWYYDVSSGQTTTCQSTNSCRLLAEATSNDSLGYDRLETYDSLARPYRSSVTIDQLFGGTAYTTTTTYDPASRVKAITDASGFKQVHNYNPQGYPCEIDQYLTGTLPRWTTNCNATTSTVTSPIWTANSRDAALHLLSQTYGNGLSSTETFWPTTQRLHTIRTGPTNNIQNNVYTWDAAGNLLDRNDALHHVDEDLTYDVDNRLTSSVLTNTSNSTTINTKTVIYDTVGAGNIICKDDLGACSLSTPNYTYGAHGGGPHAVSSMSGTVNNGVNTYTNINYWYDANGNVTVGGGRSYTYSVFNVPNCIAPGSGCTNGTGTNATQFTFDPEHRRTIQTNGSTQTSTSYVYSGGVQTEINTTGSTTVYRSYLVADGEAIGLVTTPYGVTNPTRTITYFHTDHLGSVSAITDASGTLQEQDAYDAWGKRRCANVNSALGCSVAGADDPGDQITSQTTRGFTDQEHLTGTGLIHMNGRVYDPQIAKFTSADPTTQHPTSTLGWNRYAYTDDNPLNATDPTGFDGDPAGTATGGVGWGVADPEGLSDTPSGDDMSSGQEYGGTFSDASTNLSRGNPTTANTPSGDEVALMTPARPHSDYQKEWIAANAVGSTPASVRGEPVGAGQQSKLQGNPQLTRGPNGPAHASTSLEEAMENARDPSAERVHMNQSLRTITGDRSAPDLRPDVCTVREPNADGIRDIDITEVLSPSQKASDLVEKWEGVKLPDGYKLGDMKVVEPRAPTPSPTPPPAPTVEEPPLTIQEKINLMGLRGAFVEDF